MVAEIGRFSVDIVFHARKEQTGRLFVCKSSSQSFRIKYLEFFWVYVELKILVFNHLALEHANIPRSKQMHATHYLPRLC